MSGVLFELWVPVVVVAHLFAGCWLLQTLFLYNPGVLQSLSASAVRLLGQAVTNVTTFRGFRAASTGAVPSDTLCGLVPSASVSRSQGPRGCMCGMCHMCVLHLRAACTARVLRVLPVPPVLHVLHVLHECCLRCMCCMFCMSAAVCRLCWM
jgi:hypothetical protein